MSLYSQVANWFRWIYWTNLRLLGFIWVGLSFFVQVSAAMLVAVAMPAVPNQEKLATYTRLVEAAVPFLAAVMGAYTFAPDNEPTIELLLTCPRPLWRTVLERSVCMASILIISSAASSLTFLTLTGQLDINNLVQLAAVLGPPGLFVGALALTTTMYTARGTIGLLSTLTACLMMAALPDDLLTTFPLLRWIYIFPFGRYGITWTSWSANRLTLTALGTLVSISSLYFARSSERLLRI